MAAREGKVSFLQRRGPGEATNLPGGAPTSMHIQATLSGLGGLKCRAHEIGREKPWRDRGEIEVWS